jgi:hypothetical protein
VGATKLVYSGGPTMLGSAVSVYYLFYGGASSATVTALSNFIPDLAGSSWWVRGNDYGVTYNRPDSGFYL